MGPGSLAVDPATVRLFVPPGLRGFKQALFDRIGGKCGGMIRYDYQAIEKLPDTFLPVVGCSQPLRPIIAQWRSNGRQWAYWDRGYTRRVFATWLPRGTDGGYYRWHLGAFQMQSIRRVPDDRWLAQKIDVLPWAKGGKHIVVAQPPLTYATFHGIPDWIYRTIEQLRTLTDRPIVTRDKESKRPLQNDLVGAHVLVTHGSIAAVEAVICGCPVIVHPDSAAALVGLTDLAQLESPIYPDREPWLHSLAYCQFNERELVDGTLWRLIE